jgi:hypothetical protein
VKKSLIGMLMCVVSTLPAVAQSESSSQTERAAVVAAKGKMLVAANGARLGLVYRVTPDGSVQIIIDGKVTTIPAATLSMANGELTTSLSKNDVIALH